MKFFRKLGFQLVLFFIVAITIPIVMLMVSSITTTSSSMEKNGIKSKKITIITNDFHECRASEFAKQNGFKPLRYPSKTPWNGYMPFATREIFAIIYQIYLAR